jgi:hypothetical protein
MNQPTMNNEQFALWFAAGQGPSTKLFDNAEAIYLWLEKKSEKKVVKPIMPKGK